ncbi:MAG: class I SAM-dependent RNA methyltransferase [Rhodobiaceae bacterium]|nr:class I SAM-dependent RNA methyltransferase [Rhodobiaceae bacterium]
MRGRGRGRRAPRKALPSAVSEEVTIGEIGHRGDGIAQCGGGTVYVPFTLPGERVRIMRRGERGEVGEIIDASPQRIEPLCRHFAQCGGCRLQHWESAPYLAWKRDQVIAALAARGLQAEVAPVHGLPPRSRRRAVLAARNAGGGVELGYHAPSSHDLVAISECPVLTPELEAALEPAARLLARAPAFRGELRITLLQSDNGTDMAVEGGAAPRSPDALADIAAIAAIGGFARVTWDSELLLQRAVPVQRFGAVAVVPPPGGFLQAAAEGEEALARLVLAGVGEATNIADLFAGCGTFALRLARRARVSAVEGDRVALAALEKASHMPGLKGVTCLARDLFEEPLREKDLAGFDAVVLDPPFAGARAQAEALAASTVARIVMVSCNPATFARDARILVDGGYALTRVAPVDQFVFSPHIELVGHFQR